MEKVLADSRDMVGFMIEQQAQEAGDGDIERVKALRNLWSILRKTPDELVRGEMLKKLPQAFRMSEREVKDYLGFKEKARVDAVAAAEPGKGEAVKRELEIIIGAAIDYPSLTPDIYHRSQDVIEDFSVQRILHQLAAAAEESRDTGESPDFSGIAEGIVDEDLRDWFMRRVVGESAQFEDEEEALRAALDCIEKLHKESMEREIRQQGQLAHEALEQGDDDRYMKILAEQQKLRRKAKKILY